jgi:hypothetical protein
MTNIIGTVIAVVIGGLLNMVVAVWAEHRRQATLKLNIREPDAADLILNGSSVGQFRSLKIQVMNVPLGLLGKWMRSPALQAHSLITFHRVADGSEIFGRPMEGRWANSLQPTPTPIVDTNGNVSLFLHDAERLNAGSRIDIYPGESALLDIAVRFQGDTDCYGWNNETYFAQPYGKNPNWRLGSHVFLVKVTVSSTGRKRRGVFRLINDVPYDAFRLEPASQEEIARVS